MYFPDVLPVMDRRSFFTASFGALVTLSFSGVSSAGTQEDDEDSTDREDSDQEDSDQKYVRGERDVDLSTSVVEDGEHVEYIEEEDTVRFPIGMSGDEPVGFETEPWKEWAEMQCAMPAAKKASDYLEREHGVEAGGGISGGDGELLATVGFFNEEHTLDEIAPLTPSSVTVTYQLGERTYESEVPIFVKSPPEIQIGGLRSETAEIEQSTNSTDNATAAGNNSQQVTDQSTETKSRGERERTATATESDTGEQNSSDSTDEDREDDGSGPGFGVGSAIAGLSTVGYLLGRRTSDPDQSE
jgi:PGF-CTERM protein